MTSNHSIEFFENQFQRQVAQREFVLNPFENLALEHVWGEVLDLGCGLGNLGIEAAHRGHRVLAIDGSETAIRHIGVMADREQLDLEALVADLSNFTITGQYDTVVSIGLLMFLARDQALSLLTQIQEAVRPGGRAIVNVMVEGTTYIAMFDPKGHYLFPRGDLERCFAAWEILVVRNDSFPAPGDTQKEFTTVVAVKPADRAGGTTHSTVGSAR